MNNLITKHKSQVRFYVCIMDNKEEIKEVEKYFIRELAPAWNIQR